MKRIILFLGIAGYLTAGVDARDLGQWENADPAIRQWYQSLMQPDAPHASCCGEADAYWADEIHVRNGKTYVRVTDDRPDEPLGRAHIDNGTAATVTCSVTFSPAACEGLINASGYAGNRSAAAWTHVCRSAHCNCRPVVHPSTSC